MIPDRGPCSFRRFSNGVMAEGHDSIFSVAERRIPYENPENPSSAPRRGAGGPGRPAAVRPRLRGGGGRRSRQQHVRHLLGPGPPHHRHHPGPHHQGSLQLPLHRRAGGCPFLLRVRPRGDPGHDRQRRPRGRHRGQRRHLPFPGVPGHHRGPGQRRRRLRRLRPLGGEEHPHPGGRAAGDLRSRRADLHRRLLQLPHRGLRHALRHRPASDLPAEACLPHRCHRRSHLHDRPHLLLGRRRLLHRGGPGHRHHRHPALHPGHPL